MLKIQDPVLASVAALVVVQVTVYQSVTRAIQYSAGIVAGMAGALVVGRYLGIKSVLSKLPADARCRCGAARVCPEGHDGSG